MNRNFKSRIAYEVLVILGVLLLLCYVTRLWPLIFLVILGILIAALRLLCLSAKKDTSNISPAAPPSPPRYDTEQDVIRIAFGILQRRVTDQVTSRYPSARWIWESPNAMERFAGGLSLTILLNRAGGFIKAAVQIQNLQFRGLQYETVEPEDMTGAPPDSDTEDAPGSDMESTDYSVIAFEWTDANLLSLNTLCNEALGRGETTVLIPARDLPSPDSWQDICSELTRNGFIEADAGEDGILVTLPK